MRILLLLFVLASSSLWAEDLPRFDRLDVFELEWVSNPQISPDGRRVVYQRNSMDIMTDSDTGRLWIINADGSGNMPLTGRDVSESGAAWSPDGTRIAFTSSTDNGSEIHVYWLANGKTARLTQLDRSPRGLSWSPDGEQIAFSMLVPEAPPVLVTPPQKPEGAEWAEAPRVTTRLKYEQDGSGYIETGYNHHFVVPADGGSARQVTRGEFQHSEAPQWSADGKSLVFSGNRNADWEHEFENSEIYRVELDSGEITALTERNGPDFSPHVSPDGRKIAFLGFEDKVRTYQLTRLQVMNVDGTGGRDLLPELDRSVSDMRWNKSSDGLYFQYDDHGDTKIGFVSLAGKFREVATNLGGTTIGRPYGGGSFSLSSSGRIAYTHVTAYRPADLAIVDGRGGKVNVITSLNADLLQHRSLSQVEETWYKSTVDGRDIHGWVVTPPGYDKSKSYPLIVENHGGPISNYGARFSPEIQLYAAAGYVVFYPNPRGSTSYGEEFGDLLFNNYPGDDYQDVMDGVDTLVDAGVADEDRLYITGGSAGGIMTAWAIGKTNRFRAAAVVKPVMNWVSKTLTADNYYGYANYRYKGQPWENIEGYMQFSPISLVGNVETPTLVMVGTADMRTPISEAKQLYNALKIRGIDTALVEVPGAPHNIAGRPSQLITKIDHVLAWFADR
jgi:dipeptidyl aminopeptidase/acylaminoacyl peptidase